MTAHTAVNISSYESRWVTIYLTNFTSHHTNYLWGIDLSTLFINKIRSRLLQAPAECVMYLCKEHCNLSTCHLCSTSYILIICASIFKCCCVLCSSLYLYNECQADARNHWLFHAGLLRLPMIEGIQRARPPFVPGWLAPLTWPQM